MALNDKNRKKTKNKDISSMMIAISAAAMFVLIVVFGVVSFIIARVKTETDSQVTMHNASNVISGLVSDYMGGKITDVSVLAADESAADYAAAMAGYEYGSDVYAEIDGEAIQQKLNKIVISNSDVVSAWIVSESSGVLIADNGRYIDSDDFNLYGRYWYKDFNVQNGVMCASVSEGYFDASENTIAIIAPLHKNGNIVGYAGVEIAEAGIAKILNQYTLSSGCYPLITCNYGTVVYAPDTAEFNSAFKIKQMPLLNVLIQASSLSNGLDSYSEGIQQKVYYNIDNSSVPGWSIIVLFDSDVLNGGIYNFFVIEMVLLTCFIVIVLIVLKNRLKAATWIIPKLNEAITEISNGNYKYAIDTTFAENNGLIEMASRINGIAESMGEKNEIILSYMSRDTLTGLPNRTSLYDHLEMLISRDRTDNTAEDNNRFAVMFIDIDNFKWLNETLGHNFGDSVLSTFASMLSSSLNKYGKVYRFSGDEFIILVEFGNDYNKIQEIVEILQNTFSHQIKIMTDNIYIKFSVGVAIFPDDDVTVDMLLRDADLALHRAKEGGKDRVSFYSNAAKRHSFSKAAIAQQLSTALKDGEMFLNYQPIISTETGDIHGFEVLLRWTSSLYGHVPPSEFITVAEETGEIVQIGTWIFENSCRFLKTLCDNYRDDIIMSINVSPVQLKRADFLDLVNRIIDITQVNPVNIQIEITESTLIDFVDTDITVFEKLNDMGISIALDDFGTGYSSLNYLKNFPIKCLKIDKSFVDEINNNKRDYAITDSIIDLVHNLDIKTVAEGIETVGQYNFLCEMKCDYIQGFLMSKPLDEVTALEFVEKYDALHKPDSRSLAEHERQLAKEKKERARNKEVSNAMSDGDSDSSSKLMDVFISK
ncbi:MAG: EAL domain-containing protein [Oscillospiraceae bacterium]|nr:EAL domain-containing protein [Oscillospiraceae bacterium]